MIDISSSHPREWLRAALGQTDRRIIGNGQESGVKMPRQFIGQDGFYPKWTSRNGRWVFQRVLTTVGTTMDQMETLLRPAESHEAPLWAPKRKTILESLRPGDADIRRAIYELQHLPLICCRCDWQGKGPFIRFANYRPAHWRLRCPECESMVEPDVDSIDWDKAKQVLVERWIERRRPRLDPPEPP